MCCIPWAHMTEQLNNTKVESMPIQEKRRPFFLREKYINILLTSVPLWQKSLSKLLKRNL